MTETPDFTLSCPLPIQQYPQVLLAHGGGGKLMHQLIEKMFLPTFDNSTINLRHDAANINLSTNKIAFTTDSYIVKPLFFPGGNIGQLAVNGTVNDLAMSGAKPLYLSVGLIIEEGLEMAILWQVINEIKNAAANANVQIVTGDTKVVDKGKGDGIFINTSGIGIIEHDLNIVPQSLQEGDLILINGDIARHGMAIMTVREGLEMESKIESDCASLADLVLELIKQKIEIHCMRDLTRGGLGSALNEIAETANLGIMIEETKIPIREDVQGCCEILGFDPLYVANEGKFIAFIPEKHSKKALEIMRSHPLGKEAEIIGNVNRKSPGIVQIKSQIGTTRIVDMLSGEQLPRIC
ncbi:MAG TPA: hydrogenase expression/formation protein HypE [Allocoleopsis sp.]